MLDTSLFSAEYVFCFRIRKKESACVKIIFDTDMLTDC